MSSIILPWLASILAVLIGLAAVIRKGNALASWLFFAGMLLLAADRVLEWQVMAERDPEEAKRGLCSILELQSLLPGIWLPFSAIYGRSLSRQYLHRWCIPMILVILGLPFAALGLASQLVTLIPAAQHANELTLKLEQPAKLLILLQLVFVVGVLFNLERTFRASVGIIRWRVKYFFLGALFIFGVKLYTLSQALLFSEFSPAVGDVSSISVILGCLLMGVAYVRKGFGEFEIYPSRAVLQKSLTVLFAGGYLMVVGFMAQVTARLGGSEYFPTTAFIVLIGVAGLAVLLLSDRLRDRMHRFVSLHFHRPRYDFRKIWTDLTSRLTTVLDRSALCKACAQQVSETFHVLNVSPFLLVEGGVQLMPGVSTTSDIDVRGDDVISLDATALRSHCEEGHAFELDGIDSPWAEVLRGVCPVQFAYGGGRTVVPMCAGNLLLGILVLADRVNGASYTDEEVDLLECIADQLAAALLNGALTEDLVKAREMEAFHAFSSFFVHDLKNAAHGLNLMLQNLPVHFDNPEFRTDALRGISGTVDRINQMISRLSALRESPAIVPVEYDFNLLVEEVLERSRAEMQGVTVNRSFRPLPKIRIDHERMRSVVTNLMINAHEATGGKGDIVVDTRHEAERVVFSVADNGCGMTDDFIRRHLFRPFHSTKNKGLGIGMYQSRMIVEAHRGSIQVESIPERGTTFRVYLPVFPM